MVNIKSWTYINFEILSADPAAGEEALIKDFHKKNIDEQDDAETCIAQPFVSRPVTKYHAKKNGEKFKFQNGLDVNVASEQEPA